MNQAPAPRWIAAGELAQEVIAMARYMHLL